MYHQNIFYLCGKHVFPTPDDHVLDPPGNAYIAAGIHGAKVACMQPTVVIDSVFCGLWVVVVSDHVAIGSYADFSNAVESDNLVGFQTSNADLGLWQWLAYGVTNIINGVIGKVLCDDR